jgi:hypothetical protein
LSNFHQCLALAGPWAAAEEVTRNLFCSKQQKQQKQKKKELFDGLCVCVRRVFYVILISSREKIKMVIGLNDECVTTRKKKNGTGIR